MGTRIADRLAESRQRAFVGRTDELDLFASLLAADELPVSVLFVHGPAGVGKTALLHRFTDLCREAGTACALVDGRDIPAVPDGVLAALVPAAPRLGAGGRAVLLIDTYELLDPLDEWMRGSLLPDLPADTLVVLAGQLPPKAAWRTDPGWSDLLHVIELGNLTPEESKAYLDRRGVRPEHAGDLSAAVAFTHGHPLALALVSEVLRAKGGGFVPREAPDLIKVLLDRLLQVVPTPAHRAALEACAQVRVTTQSLLAAMLGTPDVDEVFDWLRSLPFVSSGPLGLFPHDLARNVLEADLRWRDPERYAVLHDRARTYLLAQLPSADGAGHARILLDLMFLHQDLRRFMQADGGGGPGLRPDRATETDYPAVVAMVGRHEGAESAELAAYWLASQPEAWQVIRDDTGDVRGALCLLRLPLVDPLRDPAVTAALREVSRHAPLRPGETATLVRFWLAKDTYQDVSDVQSVVAAQLARHYLTTPGLSLTLLPFADPAPWVEFCAYADQTRMPDADFSVGGRSYAVYGHDWRTVPPAVWVALLSQRETSLVPLTVPGPRTEARVVVLPEAEFRAAVRAALRDLTRPDRLSRNPLLRCRLLGVSGADDRASRVAALQAMVRGAAETLKASPADARGYRALHRAYLAPAPSLERAAQSLGLPSSTFRRHLTHGVTRLADLLWAQELDAP